MLQAATQALLMWLSHLTDFAGTPAPCFRPKDHLAWSLVSSSSTLSGFSAVLAAFMFAAMVLLLTRELKEYARGRLRSAIDPELGLPISFMFAAFFSLVMAAFLFAAITGEEADRTNPKQFIEGALPSLVLALGVAQLAVGLAWLLKVRDLVGVPMDLARLFVHATIVLAAFFLTGIVVSPVVQRLVDPGLAVNTGIAWVVLMAVILAAIPLGVLSRESVRRRLGQDQIVRYVNVGSILISLGGALGWTLINGAGRCDVLPLYSSSSGNLFLLGAFALVAMMFASLEVAMPGRELPLRGLGS